MTIPDSGRTNDFYKKWHAAVKRRDKGKCVWPDCKKRGKEVHHIVPYSVAPHLRYEVGNGCCLCVAHHKSIKGRENDFVGMFIAILQKHKKK